MSLKAGDRLPNAQLMVMRDGAPQTVTSHELALGRRTVWFAVPGAFTPTCSVKHLPSFVECADAIKAKGVDEIFCIAVNDPFVLGAWKDAEDADSIVMVSDGNGAFASAMGLELNVSRFGMGTRSQRYAMVVDGLGVITALGVEPGLGVTVSGAQAILEEL